MSRGAAQPSYISESVALETNGSDGVTPGIVILDVSAYSSGIAISGRCDTDPLPSSLPSIEYTSDDSLGPMGTTPVDATGEFTAAFEFPVAHVASTAPPYDIASIGGQFVYLDLHKGLWADRDGGEFRPIAGWDR